MKQTDGTYTTHEERNKQAYKLFVEKPEGRTSAKT
jgi:hypothetical protein